MAAGHGGDRPGSGRPKGSTRKAPASKPGATHYEDALAYLEAVVRGDEPADGLRIAAARVVLPFQKPKVRAPVESPAPRKIRAQAESGIDAEERTAWNARAAKVRENMKGKPDGAR